MEVPRSRADVWSAGSLTDLFFSLSPFTSPRFSPIPCRGPFAFRHSRAGWKGTKKDRSFGYDIIRDRQETAKTATRSTREVATDFSE